MRFLLGSDPELMVRDNETQQLRSAIPIIPEGKGAGRMLGKSGNSALHDNVLVEFNSKPAATEAAFVRTMGSALKGISKLVKKAGCELVLRASANYPEKELDNEEARVFGCEPDYDAYLLEMNVPPSEAAETPFRTAGGHLHIGKGDNAAINELLDDDFGGKLFVVKALDVFCAIPGVFMDKDASAPARRRQYGKAGSHRPKTYGVEYRALSSWWLASPDHTKVIYRLTSAALKAVEKGKLGSIVSAIGGEAEVVRIVNKCDVVAARLAYTEHILPHITRPCAALVEAIDESETDELLSAWNL